VSVKVSVREEKGGGIPEIDAFLANKPAVSFPRIPT